MAFPFKSGGDFYTQELLRVRLQNFDGDLPEYGTGSIYHNTSTGLNTSDRIRYRGKTTWYSVANMDDIQRLEGLIEELDFASSGDFTALIKRVQSVEENFTDGVAKDSAKLGGQLPSYYATQSAFSALQEKVNAFLNGDVDSDAVLENLKEIQAFLDNYDGATSLADMFDAVDAKLADRYTKGESDARYLQLTGGTMTGNIVINYSEFGENTTYGGFVRFGSNYLHITNDAAYYNWNTLLHTGNYSDLITTLNGNLSVGGNISLQNTGQLRYDNKEVIQYVASNNSLYIGYGTAGSSEAWNTSVWGNNIKLINKSGTTLLHAKDSNDVTIGYLDAISVLSNQDVHIKGNLIVEGEVSAKGKGQEGGENTGGGFQLFDETNSWDSYEASMQDWILTAYHGKLFNDRISLLENKATKVEVSNLLSSGTKIATIKVDNNSYDVLAPFADAYTKTESDARYLKLSGGEIRNAGTNLFTINRSDGNPTIAFAYNDTFMGRLGFDTVGNPVALVGNTYNTLLHSGNFENLIGDTYLKIDGSNKMTSGIKWEEATTWDVIGWGTKQGLRIVEISDTTMIGAPSTNAIGLAVSGVFGFILAHDAYWGAEVFKLKSHSMTNWKTIAFTDSDITGNAGSATKLQDNTAYTIWGQTFFENGKPKNVRWDLYLGDGHLFGFHTNEPIIHQDSTGAAFGYSNIGNKLSTYVDGSTIIFRTGSYRHAMTITEDGKVLVGDNTNTLSATLKLVGLTHLAGVSSAPVLGNVTKIGLAIGANAYGMQHWVDGSGQGNIQAGRFDGTATAYALNLNPLGGNVGIGTTNPNYKLHVDGDGYFSSNLYIGGHIVSKLSDFYMFYDSSKVFLQAGSTGVFLGEGTQDTTYLSLHGKFIRMVTNGVEKMRITEDGTVSFYNNVHVNTRLLIGGASDDGSTALQVTGELKVSRLSNTNHTYLRINSSDNLVNYIGHDLDDGFCSHKFMSHDNTLMVLSGHPSGISTIYTPLDIHGTTRILNYLIADATTLASLIVNNAATFNGGVDIPMGQSLKIGDATIKYEGGALKVDKSIHSEGEVSAKGKGTEGAGGTTEGGGNSMKAAFNIPMGSQSHICEHNFHTREVTVCIYEDSGDYQQVLADVYLDDENNVRVQFGSATDVPHRVIIMA